MSDAHGDAIWNRGSAREIMREARARYGRHSNSVSSFTALASTHYSLVKRYSGWKLPLALWHLRRAVVYARRVAYMPYRKVDQTDVISTILAKAPWWLGGRRQLAKALITEVLNYVPVVEPVDEMLPHTRALMLITLAGIEERESDSTEALGHYYDAWEQIAGILKEPDQLMAKRQLVRVKLAIGLGLYRMGVRDGLNAILEARMLAMEVSQDQLEKIDRECRKHGIVLHMSGE